MERDYWRRLGDGRPRLSLARLLQWGALAPTVAGIRSLTALRGKMVEQLARNFSGGLGCADSQQQFVRSLVQLEREEHATELFFADHLSHTIQRS